MADLPGLDHVPVLAEPVLAGFTALEALLDRLWQVSPHWLVRRRGSHWPFDLARVTGTVCCR